MHNFQNTQQRFCVHHQREPSEKNYWSKPTIVGEAGFKNIAFGNLECNVPKVRMVLSTLFFTDAFNRIYLITRSNKKALHKTYMYEAKS